MKILFPLLMLSTLLVSCGKSSSSNDTSQLVDVTAPATPEYLAQLEPGEYQVSCNLNNAATISYSIDIYTSATLTLKSDNTGSIEYQAYFDKNCSKFAARGIITLDHYTTEIIDGVTVLHSVQIRETKSILSWAPYTQVNGIFYMDLSQDEDVSGAYVETKPSSKDLEDFIKSPENEKYTRIDI